jgi:hypothetical protein
MNAWSTRCRRCTACEGCTHHWVERGDARETFPLYTHVCKHCDAVGIYCSVCQGNGCHVCANEGMEFVAMMPPCAWCSTRISSPQAAVICDEAYGLSATALYCSSECHEQDTCGHHAYEEYEEE